MTDSFMHNHQAALDSQREENAINWSFPEPDNDEILEDIYEDVRTRIRQAKDRASSNMGASADAIYKFSVFETREFGSAEAAVDMGVLLEGLSTIFKVTRKREAEELELTGKRYGKNISFRRMEKRISRCV